MKMFEFLKDTMSRNERSLAAILLLFMAIFGIFDFLGDLSAYAPVAHLATELILSLLGLIGALALVVRLFRLQGRLQLAHSDVESYKADALKWKAESAKYITGLSKEIDNQFERWGLTSAEKEIALFLLKGFSLKEISEIRGVSEKTISHQTVSVYNKSGTNGRTALSAFFLEDLLAPLPQATVFLRNSAP